jgi:hypothetical protein
MTPVVRQGSAMTRTAGQACYFMAHLPTLAELIEAATEGGDQPHGHRQAFSYQLAGECWAEGRTSPLRLEAFDR